MLDQILYRWRYIAVVCSIIISLYIVIIWWIAIPFSDFEFHWRPEDQLQIKSVPENSLLQEQDVVIAIDGQRISRIATPYRTLIKNSYTFDVQRNEEELKLVIPFEYGASVGLSYRLPTTVLGMAFILVGAVIAAFANKASIIATKTAYTFMIQGIAILGLQGELINVPGAWITRLLWGISIVSTLYLSFAPQSIPTKFRRSVNVAYALGVLFGFVGFLEAWILFPQQSSLDRILGIGYYEIALLLGGLAWLITLCVLFVKSRLVTISQRRDANILLYLAALGIVPVIFLTILPRIILDVVFLPFPAAIAMFALIPLAYFFVIYRDGYLGIEIVFSNLTYFLTLLVLTVTIYGVGLVWLINQFNFENNLVMAATIMLVPITGIIAISSRLISNWISTLFYGSVVQQQSFPNLWAQLSSKPSTETLQGIVENVSKDFGVRTSALILRDIDSVFCAEFLYGDQAKWDDRKDIHPFFQPIVRPVTQRKAEHNALLNSNDWIELLVPLVTRGQMVGFLAFSKPNDGAFNSMQITFLERIADMLAIGSEAVFLFDAAGKWSLQLLKEKEEQRKQLASQIHDEPLQLITLVANNIQQLCKQTNLNKWERNLVNEAASKLNAAMAQLRQICSGLFPPVIEQGIDMVLIDVIERFESDGLIIKRDFDANFWDISDIRLSNVIYRVLTESLNNIKKHVGPTAQAYVTLRRREKTLCLDVCDSGGGIDVENLSLVELAKNHHVGLRSMHEFVKLVDGELRIGKNNPGARLTFIMPFEVST